MSTCGQGKTIMPPSETKEGHDLKTMTVSSVSFWVIGVGKKENLILKQSSLQDILYY